MSHIDSLEDIENGIKNMRVSGYSLSEKIIKKLTENNKKIISAERYKISKKVLIPVMIIFVLTISGIATAKISGIWQIKDEKGEVTLTYKIFDKKPYIDGATPAPSVTNELFKASDEVYAKLTPGKAAAIYYIYDNIKSSANNTCSVKQKPLTYTDLASLQKNTALKFKTPKYLPKGYSLKSAYTLFRWGDGHIDPNNKAILEEAKKTGKKIIVKDIKLKSNIMFIETAYEKNGVKFSVYVEQPKPNDGTGKTFYASSHDTKSLQVIKLGDIEAFYSISKDPDCIRKPGSKIIYHRKIQWKEGNLLYAVVTNNNESEFPYKELYEIAESMSY